MKNRRFMRRVPVALKLWLTTGILALPLMGLGIAYVQSLTGTLLFTQKEQRGQAFYRPLDLIIRDLTAHQSLSASTQSEVSQARLTKLSAQVDTWLDELAQADATLGTTATHSRVASVREQWQTVRRVLADRTSAEALMRAHDAALDAAFNLNGEITADC